MCFYTISTIHNAVNAIAQSCKLRDRVQNISQKVDTMKLNDSNGTAKLTATIPAAVYTHRDENSFGMCTRRRVILAAQAAAAAADADNNNEVVVSPTQGDTLNQIKAMRRRNMRIPTTPANAL